MPCDACHVAIACKHFGSSEPRHKTRPQCPRNPDGARDPGARNMMHSGAQRLCRSTSPEPRLQPWSWQLARRAGLCEYRHARGWLLPRVPHAYGRRHLRKMPWLSITLTHSNHHRDSKQSRWHVDSRMRLTTAFRKNVSTTAIMRRVSRMSASEHTWPTTQKLMHTSTQLCKVHAIMKSDGPATKARWQCWLCGLLVCYYCY